MVFGSYLYHLQRLMRFSVSALHVVYALLTVIVTQTRSMRDHNKISNCHAASAPYSECHAVFANPWVPPPTEYRFI